ncbi:MAG: von Willebrand factor type A domain-containing protein, partial [Alphaproteobacteria bacterium]
MKRKTIVIVGITGVLLAGVSGAAILAGQGWLAGKKLTGEPHMIIDQIAPQPVVGGEAGNGPELTLQSPQSQPQTRPTQPHKSVEANRAPAIMPLMEAESLAKEKKFMGGPDASSSAGYGIVAHDQIMPMPPQPGTENEKYGEFEDNPVKLVSEEPVSTFSIDVDTASYAVVRRYLMDGVLPPKDAVRTEELINYFGYDYEIPTDRQEPFDADIAVYDTPWDNGTQIIRIGLQGYDIPAEIRPAANLVFLVDTSGSMKSQDK